jgi:putative phosphoserine phosphatase / 1-acylglycerol-3-phosphate O-acyltransferase
MGATDFDSYLRAVATAAGGDRRLVIFDLDRTLIAGYSAVALSAERLRRGELSSLIGGGLDLVRDRVRARAGQGGSYRCYMQRLAQALAGCAESYLEGLGDAAWERTLSKALYPEALALVEAHRRRDINWPSSRRRPATRRSRWRAPLASTHSSARSLRCGRGA